MAQASRSNVNILIVIIFGSLLFVSISSFTRYIFAKDYNFNIETPCDPVTQNCYIRSCDDYCPPNGLEIYSVYSVKASYFDTCTTNSCENICTTNSSICVPIICEPSSEQECSNSNT